MINKLDETGTAGIAGKTPTGDAANGAAEANPADGAPVITAAEFDKINSDNATMKSQLEESNKLLKSFQEMESKRQADKDQRAKDKRDKDIVAGDHKSLAESYKKEYDLLMAKNAELLSTVANNAVIQSQLDSYKKSLEMSVQAELANFSPEQINVIKQSAVWGVDDPAGQLNAINYFKSIVGTQAKGTPGGLGMADRSASNDHKYVDMLRAGDIQGSLAMKLNGFVN